MRVLNEAGIPTIGTSGDFLQQTRLPDPRVNAIITNPPIRMGKQAVYSLFEESRAHLAPDGALYLVIRKRQGADSARCFLETTFNETVTLKKSGGYEVIRAK